METSVRFGDFELHPQRFELRRGGQTLRLERKPMEILILLTVKNGGVVTRTEIAEQLWGSDVFVDTEHGINTAVRKLRQALKDDPAEPRFIETIPKSGYRFLVPVSTQAEPLLSGGAPVVVDTPEVLFGMPRRRPMIRRIAAPGFVAVCLALAVALGMAYRSRATAPQVQYEQLTDLTDSAVAPAISPDGRTLAFIRGDDSFASGGPIYAKALSNGAIRLVTSDPRPKYGLSFTPDGSRIAYTVFGADAFATYTVPVAGGDPSLFLKNAAGLSWLSGDEVLFSKIRSGIHLGVVTAALTGTALHEVYFPSHERGMAHLSQASPDRRWVLVVEMDSSGHWGPCRLVALNGHSESRAVGPDGACTAAAWSTDGRWMYFIASLAEQSHLWRQRFPDGEPEQVTFGAGEEDGLAVDGSGGRLITSIGMKGSALWVHDEGGERALSSEGEVLNGFSPPLFRGDDTVLYYLLRRRPGPMGAELRRVETRTGRVEEVIPGVSIIDFDVSSDGRQVVYTTAGGAGSELWLARTDRSSLPTAVGVHGAAFPHFGPRGKILFQSSEGNLNYLEQVSGNGLERSKVIQSPIHEFQGVSPGGHWAMTLISEDSTRQRPTLVAIALDGSRIVPVCAGYCAPRWSPGGRSLYISTQAASAASPGQSFVFPVGPDERLPGIPPAGIEVLPARTTYAGAKPFPRADLVAGKDPEHFAFVKTTVQRNLFGVTLK